MTILSRTVFDNLAGSWTLDREITGQGHLTGRVEFTPIEGGRLQYQEKGVLRLEQDGPPGEREQYDVERRYVYESRDDALLIHYDDPYRKNEIMHELRFTRHEDGYIASHSHHCGRDRYDLTFQFNGVNVIKIHYTVNGPHKDYKMESVLTRVPG